MQQQLGRLDVGDRLVPDRGQDVVLQRCDPLSRVLGSARRFDHPLVVVARASRQRPTLAVLLELRLALHVGSGKAPAATLVQWDPHQLLQVAGLVGIAPSRLDAIAGQRRAAAQRHPQAHLAPPTAG
jgi:hypothetical protein